MKICAVSRACGISNDVHEVTIGPNSSYSGSELLPDTFCSTTDTIVNSGGSKSSTEESPVKISDSGKSKLLTDQLLDNKKARTLRTYEVLLEQQRQNEVKENLKYRYYLVNDMINEDLKELSIRLESAQRKAEVKSLVEEHELWQQVQEEELLANKRQELLADEHRQKAQRLHDRNLMLKKAEQEEEEARQEEARKLAERKDRLNKIYAYQVDSRSKYQQLVEIFKQCKDKQAANAAFTNHAPKMKSLGEAMNQLIKQCTVGEVSNLDLQTASAICQQINEILQTFQNDIVKINEECDKALAAKAKYEEEKAKAAQQLEQAKQLSESDQKQRTATEGKSDLKSSVELDCHKRFEELQQYLSQFQLSHAEIVRNDALKKFRFECQKSVNTPVNAISPVNVSHMEDKLQKLSRLLLGQTVDGRFSAAVHPGGISFCKNLLALKFVFQGELTVSSKPGAAFPIAAVIVALWVDFPDFGNLLLAHFYRECPYLVPIFLPQFEGQSNEDYYKSLGYRYNENGEVEKQDKFLKRMSGLMRLYAAILITNPRRHQKKPHPHGLGQGWRWLACLLNMDPRPDICATLLFDFLEVAGNSMHIHYGQQFQKLLHLICKEYFPKIEKISSSGGPVTRLETFLQKILKEGRISSPSGMLPPNYW